MGISSWSTQVLSMIVLTTARFLVLWVDATDAVTTEQSYKQIATAMFGSDEKKDPVQAVLLGLQKSEEEWLLVFDNAPPSSLAKYLPDGDRGNILYTSRQHNLQPRLRPECVASIDTMDAPEGILLLLRSAQKATDVTKNRELARVIVNALGLLPLAIDQAGAYIHMAPCPLDKYLAVFNEQKEVLLRSPRFKGSDEKRHIAVYATFNISYRAIKAFADKKADLIRAKDAMIALQLLNLICFYHNEGFIAFLFERAAINRHKADRAGWLPWKAGEVELEGLLQTFETDVTPEYPEGILWVCNDLVLGLGFLNEFSLLKFDDSDDYFNMHILVHEWARDRMDGDEKANWGVAAKALVMDSVRLKEDIRDTRYRRDVLPHIETCLKHVKAEHDDSAVESEYLGKAAKVFEQASNLDAAVEMMLKALEYRKTCFGLLHKGPLAAMSKLARLYLAQAKYDQAQEMLLEVIDRRTLHLKEQRWQAFHDANVGTADGELDQKAALDAYNPLENRYLWKDKIELANVLIKKDNTAAAADVMDELANWKETTHGENSPEARRWREQATRARNVGFSSPANDDKSTTIQEAQEEFENSVAELGGLHRSTIFAKKQLAKALIEQGALHEALPLLWQVCSWAENLYGENSLEQMDALADVGNLYEKLDRVYDAGDVYTITMCRYKELLGLCHPKTADSIWHLALISGAKAEYEEAVELIQTCLDIHLLTLGPEHRMTLISAHLLAQYRYYQEKLPDYARAGIRNRAVQANRDALRDSAPQWMREWEPLPEEAMMRERLDRGETIYGYKMREIDIDGLPFYRIIPVKEVKGQEITVATLQWQ